MNQSDHYGSTEIAGILLCSFLENSSNVAFAPKLSSLKKQLLAPKQFCSAYDDGELQTDGNSFGRLEDRALVADEELFRKIGARLAVMGDKLDAEIEPSFVHNLAQQFMVENVPSQRIQHLSLAVQNVMARMPRELELEKAMLLAAMVLAKKVVNVVPEILQQVFNTTVNYIDQNLHDYVNNLGPEKKSKVDYYSQDCGVDGGILKRGTEANDHLTISLDSVSFHLPSENILDL